MSQFDSHKDYYDILGANERASPRDSTLVQAQWQRGAIPTRGSEEEMKSLNEAYSVLRNKRQDASMTLQRRNCR